MYTTNYCAYCVFAKRLLSSNDIEFQEIDVSRDPDKRRWLVEATGQRTVPQIFFGNESIGGYRELAKLQSGGILFDKLME